MSLQKKFTKVYIHNKFKGNVSVSGNGSDLVQTEKLRLKLPQFMQKFNVKTFLDVPCGDFLWMEKLDLKVEKYIGGDIVNELIVKLNKEQKSDFRVFKVINLVNQVPPKVDVIFCRDLFVHLSNRDIKAAIRNIIASESKYLFTTTFTDRNENKNLPIFSKGVKWRTINLQIKPWNFPNPIDFINENCSENDYKFTDKSIGIWKISDLRFFIR